MEKLVNYLIQPDSGCWDMTLGATEVGFKSVWGRGIIVLTSEEKMRTFQAIGDAARKVMSVVFGRPALQTCKEEDGLEVYQMWYPKGEAKHTEDFENTKAFVKMCEEHRITNKIEGGHLFLYVGGEKFAEIIDGNRIKNLEKKPFSEYNLSDFAEEIIKNYIDGNIRFYMNSDGYLCE